MTQKNELKEHISIPGNLIKEYLRAWSISQVEFAYKMGMNKKTINEIIKGKAPITLETAKKLEDVLDMPYDFSLRHEKDYQNKKERMKYNG